MKSATLRPLNIVETVARHLSFSCAADELYPKQPAVSAQVKQLEARADLEQIVNWRGLVKCARYNASRGIFR